jgi:hypothetical protein
MATLVRVHQGIEGLARDQHAGVGILGPSFRRILATCKEEAPWHLLLRYPARNGDTRD